MNSPAGVDAFLVQIGNLLPEILPDLMHLLAHEADVLEDKPPHQVVGNHTAKCEVGAGLSDQTNYR